jgi:hypothetical protein
MANKGSAANENQTRAALPEKVREALVRLRKRGKDLPPVDAVSIIREGRQHEVAGQSLRRGGIDAD